MSKHKPKAARAPDDAGPRWAAPAILLHPAFAGLALVALNLFVYAQVRHFAFTNWDDPTYITENPVVRGGLTRASAWWALTTAHTPYWHPVTWLSHLLDVRLFGLDAGAHHVTSLAVHAANTLVLFGRCAA